MATEETTVALWRLGRYTLRDKLGAGGMGVVYRAIDGDGREVAVKLLHPQIANDAESRERFAREVRAVSRVRGPRVAEVLEADIAASTPYLVTRYVPGSSLQQLVATDGPLRGAALEALAADLIDALASIHEAGIVHRDLKPANVLVCGGEAYVIDFGIAQIADDTRLTVPGMVPGTPGYLAPELLAGDDAGPPGDVFAWAATVAYAATGRPPFGSGRFDVVSYAVVHKEPELAGTPRWLEPMLRRALAKDPAARPGVEELRDWAANLDITDEPVDDGAAGDRVFDWAIEAAGDWATDPPRSAGGSWPSAVPPTARLPTVVPPPAPSPPEPVPESAAEPSPWADARYDEWADDGSGSWALEPAEDAESAAAEWPPGRRDHAAEPDDRAALVGSNLATAGEKDKHPLVAGLVLLALTTGAVVAPIVCGLLVVAWLVLARTLDRYRGFVDNRRALHGRRARDTLGGVAALPWYILRSAVITVLVLGIAAVGAGVLMGFVVLFSYASALPVAFEPVYAGTLLVVTLFCLRGFQHEPVLRGSRRILHRVVGAREVAATVGVLLVIGTVVLVVLAVLGVVTYWPLHGLGVDADTVDEVWRGLTRAE